MITRFWKNSGGIGSSRQHADGKMRKRNQLTWWMTSAGQMKRSFSKCKMRLPALKLKGANREGSSPGLPGRISLTQQLQDAQSEIAALRRCAEDGEAARSQLLPFPLQCAAGRTWTERSRRKRIS
eukprot:Polyplicarium_translucidae@DN1993_c0_g1_i4.p2